MCTNMMINLVFENCVDSGEKASDVKEASGRDELRVRLDQVLKSAQNVQNRKVRMANAFRKAWDQTKIKLLLRFQRNQLTNNF